MKPGRLLLATACVLLPACTPWSPAFDAGANWYMNVWGATADDVYAVGGTPGRGAMMHLGAAGWAPVDFGTEAPQLNWAFGFSRDDVFVVGNAGTVLHWNGQSWSRGPALTDQPLWGVWGAAPNDVWAVGGSGLSSGGPLLFHFDGASWTQQPLPPLQRQNVFALFKVWGTSAQNVLVVGQEGAVLRWNGVEWKEEDAGIREDLISLWGTGPDHIIAVGGRNNGVVAVWDGSAWRGQSLAPMAGLNGVWTGTGGEAWIAGASGTVARLDTRTLRAEPEDVGTTLELHSIYGVGGRIYTVGGNLLTGASTQKFEGIALQRSE